MPAPSRSLTSNYKLAERIRRVFIVIFVLSLLYVISNIYTTSQLFKDWQDNRYQSLQGSLEEWLGQHELNLKFASYAIKPRKSSLAEFIESDNYRSIEVLLQEFKELYQLDGIFLESETEDLISDRGLVKVNRFMLFETLRQFDESPSYRAFEYSDLYSTLGSQELQTALFVGMAIPVHYDVGDQAGKVYLLKRVFVTDSEKPDLDWLKTISNFDFTPLLYKGENDYEKTLLETFRALFLTQQVSFSLPLVSQEGPESFGYFDLTLSTDEIRLALLSSVMSSVLPVLLLIFTLLYFYRLLIKRMLRPVKEMSEVSELIASGREQTRLTFMDNLPGKHWSEVEVLGVRFNELVETLSDRQATLAELNLSLEQLIVKRTSALSDANERLAKLAHSDALTGIDNRHAFDIFWGDVEDASRKGELSPIGFCIIDCDYFKGINDTYGHQAGDQVLKVVCDQVIHVIQGKGRFFRLGGDEFAVIFQNLDSHAVQDMMEQISDNIQNYPSQSLQIKEQLSVSIGMAFSDKGVISEVIDLFRHADTAMYVAKHNLREKCVLFSQTEHAKTNEELRHQNLHMVLDAVKTGEGATLFYQPIYSLSTEKVDYFEVLTRLRIGNELIFPNIFMPIVERTNLQVMFDRMVIEKVREALVSGIVQKGAGLSINLSAESLAREDVCSWFKPLIPFLIDYKIVIEITETTLIKQINEVCSYIEQFREAGFKVALDDFGSGYSSISYLAHLPVDIIKFDISLARAAFQKERSAKVIQSLVDDLSEMGYGIVFEGIEDQQMFDLLSEMGPSHFQGYHIRKPNERPLMDVSHLQAAG